MRYGAGILAGVAASALFWLLDKYLLTLPRDYQIGGAVICFGIFASAGYWLTSRAWKKLAKGNGTRIVSDLKAKNIEAKIDGVTVSGEGNTSILSDVDAEGDLKAHVKNIKSKY